MKRRHPEGVERMWAMVRWRNGRLYWRRGAPPGLLALACQLGLHLMVNDLMWDGYACRCRRQYLRHEDLWRPPTERRPTMPEPNRIFWVPQVADPDLPTIAELTDGVWLDSFIVTRPGPNPALPSMAETLLAVDEAYLIPRARVQRLLQESTASPDRGGGDLLDRIDRAVDGLCPCGADPREGSAYCSYDCEPTHVAEHTDLNGPGPVSSWHGVATPMRWRPDLVTDAPDEDLTPIGVGERRADGAVHLRLDDGHRFVGCDVAEEFQGPEGYTAAWERLERELTDPRHAVAVEPDPESFIESVLPQAIATGFTPRSENPDTLWSRWCGACRKRGEPFSTPSADWCCWCWTRLPGPAMNLSASVDFSGAWRMELGAYVGSGYVSVERVVTEADMVEAAVPLDAVRAKWVEMEDELLAAAGIVRAVARRPIAAGQMVTYDDIRMSGPVYVPPLRRPYGLGTTDRLPRNLFRITGT